MNKTIALIGNPNCGKTTLFNALTGTYQKTGNWTGVTTEKKIGRYRENKKIEIIDLPGLYALSSGSADENAVLAYLKESPPQAIINIVDGTNLERNLYLSLELIELGIPMVLAVNMYDDLKKNGITLNVNALSKAFDLPVVPISALKSLNVDRLMEVAVGVNEKPKKPNFQVDSGELFTREKYAYIESIIKGVIQKKQTKGEIFTQKADNILTHKIWGIPIFFCVITLVYFLSIKLGGFLGGYIANFLDSFTLTTKNSLIKVGASEWLVSLVCNAVFNGVGSVLSFLPQILVLFTLMSVIEQSGYASRIAFNLDRIFRSFGLGGKSLIPMIVSCGCTVTGITATRTIESEQEKKMTVFLSPFMPCSAKMAVFGWFSYKFFNGMAIVATSMYFISIIAVVVFGLVLKRFKAFSATDGGFIIEMPTLRAPALKDIFSVLWEKTKDFTAKAGSVIFLVSILLWALMNLGLNGYTFGRVEDSFLFILGNYIKYIFYPLGFGNWQATVAVLSGIMAKEAVIEALEIMGGQNIFSSVYSVYAFMTFVLLSPPCIASIATAKRELKSKKLLSFMVLFQFISAYLLAFIINGIGFLVQTGLLLSVIIVIIITLITVLCIFILKNKKCTACGKCSGDKKCQKNTKRNTI